MACLILTAGAALGTAAGETQAVQRAPDRPIGPFSTPVAPPPHTSAGASARPSGIPGADPSAEEPVTPTAAPSAIPTPVPSDGGTAAPAPPGSPAPSSPASGSPSGPASASASPSDSPATSDSDPESDSASDSDPDSASEPGSDSGSDPGSDEEPPQPEVQPPLAGREAGEGRLRPGRQLLPWELARVDNSRPRPDAPPAATDPGPAPAAIPAASTPPGTGPLSPQALNAPAVQQMKRVSLGAGITLIGLGLGFLAFRMRRPD
ncbi:hypothetical protein OG520_20590 [Streptomyces sp. NBC_00984]|uniref:hypothetical protein n=1 Tax=Streptomyces sp. NBC_00984 TaxID=2903700 RepID=UPI00386A9CDE|nr:hypothetical protein OG520_20590 [Streptomyces sp. NBC_00984]